MPMFLSRPGSAARLVRLARKELRETLRDRRTILTLVLMPLLVYPLLGLTFQRFLLTQVVTGTPASPEYAIVFADAATGETVIPLLRAAEALRGPRLTSLASKLTPSESSPVFAEFVLNPEAPNLSAALRGGFADVGIRLTSAGPPAAVELIYDSASSRAVAAKREIEDRLQAINNAWLRRKLRQAGLTTAPPITLSASLIEREGGPAVALSGVLPLVLLLMTVTGAVYPAIDLTAGERERGTLEPLIAAPISPRAVLFAKYIAVLTVAVLTAGMNLLAMSATAFAFGLDRLLGAGVTLLAIVEVVGLVIVLAAFFSAVLLLVTSFARSFKEAQAYLIPLMLVSLAPGIVSLMPELTLSLPLAVTPLVGVVLVARDLLSGGAAPLHVVACLGATLLYAALALLSAARVFGTDAVLFGAAGTWTELFRRPTTQRLVPSLTTALACLATVFPAFLLLGAVPGRFPDLSMAGRLGVSAGLTVLLFFVLPTAATLAARAGLRKTFRLRMPTLLGLLGACVLGVSLWPFAFELLLLVNRQQMAELERLLAPINAQLAAVPLPVTLLTLALLPAACEEWFFRGLLLSSLRTRLRTVPAVVVTGVLFGAFHVVVRDGLFIERIIPAAFLGLVLGTVCVRTGSLWPGIVLHALHNGLLLSLAAFQPQLSAAGWTGGEREHLPPLWLAVAAVAVLIGAGMVACSGRREDHRRAGA